MFWANKSNIKEPSRAKREEMKGRTRMKLEKLVTELLEMKKGENK